MCSSDLEGGGEEKGIMEEVGAGGGKGDQGEREAEGKGGRERGGGIGEREKNGGGERRTRGLGTGKVLDRGCYYFFGLFTRRKAPKK